MVIPLALTWTLIALAKTVTTLVVVFIVRVYIGYNVNVGYGDSTFCISFVDVFVFVTLAPNCGNPYLVLLLLESLMSTLLMTFVTPLYVSVDCSSSDSIKSLDSSLVSLILF